MLNKLAEHWVNGMKILFLKHEHPKNCVKKWLIKDWQLKPQWGPIFIPSAYQYYNC